MTTTTAPTIPAAQLAPARAMALAYGHEWAVALYRAEQDGEALPAMTPEAIAAWVVANRHPGSLAGIDGPAFDQYGNISHTTGTGRLTWYTTPDGVTIIHVNRPEWECVLQAEHFPSGNVHAWHSESTCPDPAGCYYQRHVEALAEALTALVGAARAIEATDHLRAGAVDHQLTPEQARLVEEVLYLARQSQAHGLGGYLEALERNVERLRDEHDRHVWTTTEEEVENDPFTPRPVAEGPEVRRDE